MRKNFAGLLLVAALAALAKFLEQYLFTFSEAITIGIMLALIIKNTIGVNKVFSNGVSFSAKELLKWGVVLLGLRLNIMTLLGLGPGVILLIILIVIIGLLAAIAIGKLLRLNTLLALLLGIGSSICGSSAIVAIGPVIKAKNEDITLSAAIISLLGTVGVILFSFFSTAVPLSDGSFGIWTGASLQNVAHALAAALTRGEAAVDIAAIVKMGRVTLLAPAAVLLKIFSERYIGAEAKETGRVKFPEYVIYFLTLGALASINDYLNLIPLTLAGPVEIDFLKLSKTASSWLLLAAMIAMGLQTDVRSLRNTGFKAFVACSLIFIILVSISYVAVRFMA